MSFRLRSGNKQHLLSNFPPQFHVSVLWLPFKDSVGCVDSPHFSAAKLQQDEDVHSQLRVFKFSFLNAKLSNIKLNGKVADHR